MAEFTKQVFISDSQVTLNPVALDWKREK